MSRARFPVLLLLALPLAACGEDADPAPQPVGDGARASLDVTMTQLSASDVLQAPEEDHER